MTVNAESAQAWRVGSPAEDLNNHDLMRAKSEHITKAARSATLANVLAPLLCIPAFKDEVQLENLEIWLFYMLFVVSIRTWIVFRLAHKALDIVNPERHLNLMTFAVGIVGLGWGMGWFLMAPDLLMVNRMIYVYMTTAAMIAGMFAYSVNRATFLAFTLPIMLPSIITVVWSTSFFPWPFTVGLATLYLVVFSIANNFSKTFEDSVRLRFRNERLYQELANERDQSVAANVAKSKFIAVASHDLRQPMHAVSVYLDLINMDVLPPTEKKSLHKIKNSIGALNAMFDSLLNISKLDADLMQINERLFQLDELSATVRDLSETKAIDKGLVLHVNHPKLIVRGDKLLLQQIITNLVSNAIQYTEHGEVRVDFYTTDQCLTIDVSDTGCGIAESEQQQIFHQFFRADRTRAMHDGLGLGLSIVKRLCDLMGANITVSSEMGSGSRFVVKTPFVASVSEDAIMLADDSTIIPHTSQQLQGKRIAVIEDNPDIAEAYKHTLIHKGARVYLLSEHEDALMMQLEGIDRIDCILCDYRLGQTTGNVLIEKIRESFNQEIPAIIVTADTSPSHIHLFAKLNVLVLQKPISFQEIAKAIEAKTTAEPTA